jgi:hypothetical protein
LTDICPEHKEKISLWNTCLDARGRICKDTKLIGDYIRKKRIEKIIKKQQMKAKVITL